MSDTLPAAPRDEEASVRSASRRALVVEDDGAIRSLVTHVLRRDGFEVDVATNGRAALGLICEGEYEVILLDLAMPEMNGVELLEYLRHRRLPALRRVVVMTASFHLLRQIVAADVCRVITKPFAIDELRAAIYDCAPEVVR